VFSSDVVVFLLLCSLQYFVFSHSTSRLQNQPQRHYGITSPISLTPPKDVDCIHTQKLVEAMKPFGVFEDEEELNHRYNKIATFFNLLGFFKAKLTSIFFTGWLFLVN